MDDPTQEITLANLAEKSQQEVFEYISRHLLRQGQRAMESASGLFCAYRSSNGLRCAAGCLIAPDEYLANSFEGFSWQHLVAEGTVPSAHEILIWRLQHVHDEEDPETWRLQLKTLGNTWNLSTSFLDSI